MLLVKKVLPFSFVLCFFPLYTYTLKFMSLEICSSPYSLESIYTYFNICNLHNDTFRLARICCYPCFVNEKIHSESEANYLGSYDMQMEEQKFSYELQMQPFFFFCMLHQQIIIAKMICPVELKIDISGIWFHIRIK